MNLFKEILSELNLTVYGASNASVNDKKITDAINNHWASVIRYQSEDDKGKMHVKKRLIMPVAFGQSIAGNDVIRAYQTQGDTNTIIPKWKLFRLDRILSWENKPSTNFDTNLLGSIESKYNKDGDKSMSQIYIQALPGKKRSKTGKKTKALPQNISYTPLTKKDIEQPLPTQKTQLVGKSSPNSSNNAIDNTIDNTNANYYYNIKNNNLSNNKLDMTYPNNEPITKRDINIVNNTELDKNKNNIPSNTISNNEPTNSYISKQDVKNANAQNLNNSEEDEIKSTLKEWNKKLGNI